MTAPLPGADPAKADTGAVVVGAVGRLPAGAKRAAKPCSHSSLARRAWPLVSRPLWVRPECAASSRDRLTDHGRELIRGLALGDAPGGLVVPEFEWPVRRHRHGAAHRRRGLRQERPRRGNSDLRGPRRRRAAPQGGRELGVVGAFERGAADVVHPHPRHAAVVEAEQLGGAHRNIDHAVGVVGPAVVDAHDDGFLVGEVGHPRVARDRQRRMRGRDRRHVVDFAVGGRPAVEILAVPGRQALGAVVGVFLGLVGAAADDIRLADPVGAAALGHRLAERNEARARRHAIFRIKLAGGDWPHWASTTQQPPTAPIRTIRPNLAATPPRPIGSPTREAAQTQAACPSIAFNH